MTMEGRCRSLDWIPFFLLAPLAAGAAAAEPARIELWPEGVPGLRADAAPERLQDGTITGVHFPSLTVFPAPAGEANGTAVVICPGGGYVQLAIAKEGTAIAEWFTARGVTAFVLRYRMVEYGHPAPLQDVQRAIRIVRSRAAEFSLKPDRIGVIGFSAGGHVASCAATMFDDPAGRTGAAIDAVSARPDFAILVYPVITLQDPFAHVGSRWALFGDKPAPEMVERMSTNRRVTKATPPVFIMHTTEDKVVKVENAIVFYEAAREAGVPAEMHIYQKGRHGIGMEPEYDAGREWPRACQAWLRVNGWLPAVP